MVASEDVQVSQAGEPVAAQVFPGEARVSRVEVLAAVSVAELVLVFRDVVHSVAVAPPLDARLVMRTRSLRSHKQERPRNL